MRRRDLRELGYPQGLAARTGIDPGGAQQALSLDGRPGPGGERGPQRLAPLPESGLDHGEYVRAFHGRGWGIVPREGDELGVDVRHWPEHAAGHGPGGPGRGEPGELRRWGAVDATARPGAHPVGYLRLYHDDAPLDRRERSQQVQDDRHRDVIRQIRGQYPGGKNQPPG